MDILKIIMEYDYKVFKVLLFLYWDLEYYLEDIDYVKTSLIVNKNNNLKIFDNKYFQNKDFKYFQILQVEFRNNIKSDVLFWEQNASKKPINFWSNLEIKGLFDKLWQYNIYTKIVSLDTIFKNDKNIKYYKLYANIYNNIFKNIIYSDIGFLKQEGFDSNMELPYFKNFIDDLYKV
jgi:hypothetical protein